MAWIKVRTDLADDPAVIAMSGALGIDRFGVVGRLHSIWSWATDQLKDGNASGVTVSFLDSRVGVTGFCTEMAKVGWLVIHEGGLTFPKWDVHLSSGAKQRSQTQKRVKEHRRNASTVTDALPDKRREEKSTDTHTHTAETVESPIIHRPRLSPELTPIFAAYPAHRRTGKMAALKAISRALDTLEARGQPEPGRWLLARVEEFARSWQGQSSLCWQAARWFDDGHYDDPDSAWQESCDGNRGHGGGAVGAGARGTGTYGRRTDGQYPEPPLYIPR